MKMLHILAILFTLGFAAHAQTPDFSQYSKEFFIHNGDTLRYRMLKPLHYDAHKEYPLIVVLHGSGERGNNNEAQLIHGGDMFLKDSVRKENNAIVIFPQCPTDSSWSPLHPKRDSAGKFIGLMFDGQATTPGLLVKALVDDFKANHKVDSKRIYIGGLSMGGFGTFWLLATYPDMWAAAFPICGGGQVDKAEKFKKVPVWIFHGGSDPVVPVQFSRDYYKALKDLGAEVKYNEYPGVGHNSWDNAFAEPTLIPWLLSHKKK
jgi:predicted peptidase